MYQATGTAAIELSGVSKLFDGTAAVDDLSLTIPRGCIFGLLGPNGAGKSTTIKMLMGVLRSTKGTIRLHGTDVARDPVLIKQRVGYVPETHQIYRWMRVAEVVEFCRAAFDKWNDQTCREMLGMFQLEPQKQVQHLSKGMVAKLALLLAVSHDPEALLLDEPVSGLDPLVREEFLESVLRTARRSDQTVMFSSHTLEDIEQCCDRIGILYKGRLVIEGRIDELLGRVKRVRAVLHNGRTSSPPQLLGTLYSRTEGREWQATVSSISENELQGVRASEGVEHVEVLDVRLADLFKDVVRGQEGLR
jgi:ABC-2 type transport system ATP-binding protein